MFFEAFFVYVLDSTELGNWYTCGIQVFSFLSHLFRNFFLEIENIDGEDKSFALNLNKKVTGNGRDAVQFTVGKNP